MRIYGLRTGLSMGLGVVWTLVACGSDDGSKKAQGPRFEDAGEDSGGSGSLGAGGAVEQPDSGGGGGGAVSGSTMGGDAGAPPLTEGGSAGAEPVSGGAGGMPDVGPRECPTGTADCDGNHDDCETNTADDVTNCGRCERVCGGTATCSTGLCGPTEILNPTGDSNYCDWEFSTTTAYLLTCWGSFTEIRRTPVVPGPTITGTQIQSHSLGSVTAARGMLIDGNDVLYGVQGNPSYLYKFPLDADGPEDVSIAYTFENATRFDSIQLIGDTFYWNNNSHTTANQIGPGFIGKRAKTGTSSTTLVSGLGLSYGLQVFTSNMVWLERRTTNDVLSVYRAPIVGAEVADVELVQVSAAGGYMTRQGDYAYWTHKAASPNGKIARLLVEDPAAEPEDIATNLDLPEGLVTDEEYAYFKQADALYRVPLDGGAPEQLSPAVPANDSQATAILHVDASYVYLPAGPNAGSSTVVRVAK
jgi:hypothetical protein